MFQPAAWVALVCAVFSLFIVFDWGDGAVRAGLLLALAALAWWRRRSPEPHTAPSAAWTRAALVAVAGALIVHLAVSAFWIARSVETGTVPSDQAQTVMAALDVARAGGNPWAADTFTDRVAYELAVEELRSKPACGAVPAAAVVPSIDPATECAHTGTLFTSLGFKYGPAMLAFYWPFIAAFGAAGIPISHLLLFLFTVAAIGSWARAQRGAAFWTALAIAPFVLTPHIATNVLAQGHLDMFPTLLCLLAVIAAERLQYAVAGCALGMSIAAKFLPGLLFVPLLLGGPWWSIALALAIPLACFAPFAMSDWTGLRHNLGYPFFRDPDSTALMFSLSGPPVWIVRLAAIAVIAWLLLRAQRRHWARGETLEWIVGAQLAILATGSTLHNNYLVWLLPYFGFLTFAANER